MARLEQGGVDLAHGVMHCPSPHPHTIPIPHTSYIAHRTIGIDMIPISHTSYIAHRTNITYFAHGVMHCPSPPYHRTNTTYILQCTLLHCPPFHYDAHYIALYLLI